MANAPIARAGAERPLVQCAAQGIVEAEALLHAQELQLAQVVVGCPEAASSAAARPSMMGTVSGKADAAACLG